MKVINVMKNYFVILFTFSYLTIYNIYSSLFIPHKVSKKHKTFHVFCPTSDSFSFFYINYTSSGSPSSYKAHLGFLFHLFRATSSPFCL